MRKIFNVNGVCVSDLHYMVDLENRLEAIKAMVDAGQYFTINKARQYGKTTTLRALAGYLQGGYIVVSLDFQRMSCSDFASEAAFVNGLAREIAKKVRRMENVSAQVETELIELSKNTNNNVRMADIFDCFNHWCEQSDKSIVLLVDEVDTAADNQVFLDFLAQLRACYLDRMETPTFQSVILASVYDVRNMRQKIRLEEEHRQNSPWNIAAKFRVHFDDVYGDQDKRFLEEDGRRNFMLYLKPIINGTGNYYVESRTRNQERTDLIVDYRGEQYIIEMKVWRGNAYHERGEEQLAGYLDHYHLNKGYLLSFQFNKTKETGVREIKVGDKVIVEAVV